MPDLSALSKPKGKSKGKRSPFAAAGAPDPLANVVYCDPPDLEADSAAELSALQSAFKARTKREAKRFRDVTDSEYWVAMCFQTREDKDRFLRALNLIQLGDKYIDGHKAAQLLGVDLSSRF